MATKFSMESDALHNHLQKSESLGGDLIGTVNRMFAAAEPLTAKFSGPAKAQFDKFHAEADRCAADLQTAFAGLTRSVSVQNKTFITAAEEGAAAHQATAAAQDFTAAITRNV